MQQALCICDHAVRDPANFASQTQGIRGRDRSGCQKTYVARKTYNSDDFKQRYKELKKSN